MVDEMLTASSAVFGVPWVREVVILVLTVAAAVVVRLGVSRLLLAITSRTATDVDDQVVAACRRPLVYLVLLAGAGWMAAGLDVPVHVASVTTSILKTLAVILISSALLRVLMVLLTAMSGQSGRVSFIQPKTLPLLEMVAKLVTAGGAVYFIFMTWSIDVKAWLASAGIIGIAVGFAAKDTLANLFSGIFILADAPYKIGDFIIFDNGIRGQVVDIGIRSTRILTRDDVEVTVPNAVIAGSKIVNETAGRHPKMRVRVKVGVAYGSDVDQVRRVLLECADGVDKVESDPEPRVRFRAFGDSSLDFELLVWVQEPLYRGRVLDAVNERVYKAFAREGIKIPFTQMDVHLVRAAGPADR